MPVPLRHQPFVALPGPPTEEEDETQLRSMTPLLPYTLLEGQITDPIGAGLSGVVVVVRRKDADPRPVPIASATTDDLGDFRVRTLEPIEANVLVTLTRQHFKPAVHELRVGEGKLPPYVAQSLEGDVTVSGRVVDARTQQAVVNARIELRSMAGDFDVFSDGDGRFQIRGVSPGPAELSTFAEGFGQEALRIKDAAAEQELTIALRPQRVVTIEVLDDAGQPVPGATVETSVSRPYDFRFAITDDRGRVVLRGLNDRSDRIDVRLTHEKYVSSLDFDRTIMLPADPLESTHSLTLAPAGRLVGTITSRRTGEPLHGARVTVGSNSRQRLAQGWSDFNGRYELGSVPLGEAVVTVHHKGFAPELTVVRVAPSDAAQLDVQLDEALTLQGRVRTTGDRPVVGAQVEADEWRGHQTLDLRGLTDEDGRFVIHDAPTDSIGITVYASFGRQAVQTVRAGAEPAFVVLPEAPAIDLVTTGKRISAGSPVPAVTLKTLDGSSLDLSTLLGRVVVVDFWATWCAPCVAELPALRALYERYRARADFAMLSVSLDTDSASIRDTLQRFDVTWPQACGEESGAFRAAEAFRVASLPTLFVIDAQGTVAGAATTVDQLGTLLEALLKEPERP